MGELMSTVYGDIPGLLRRGSPVHWRDEQTPYVAAWVGPWPDADIDDGAIVQAAPSGYGLICIEDTAKNFALDLTDPTGRAHAAWWAMGKAPGVTVLQASSTARTIAEERACRRAVYREPISSTQIDLLARLVLRLAGRPCP